MNGKCEEFHSAVKFLASRNPINKSQIIKNQKSHEIGKTMYAANEAKAFAKKLSDHEREFIQERNLMDAICVQKYSQESPGSVNIRESIRKTIHLLAVNVEKSSP